ncbi:MAG: aminoacyl-tRNA hydrolase [Bacteroidetes bacterium HGW-Bacteroidetes-6]|jgi:PTH1 family peptidyl-tRNA hydrolase|nr:MAG: aminoacyl-tRNA hydrolase [Bacteroidetes bacterium HGW-Bacteroidetes-6]
MRTYVIVGLGNPGREYAGTRHNIGFEILDWLAGSRGAVFTPSRYADMATYTLKGRKIVLIKPSTYMNLSGKAVAYWIQNEKPEPENLLVIADDVALPTGTIRMRKKGGAGGHNGLENIIITLNTEIYSRLRFGIGNDYPRGMQSEYVLGHWFPEQVPVVTERIKLAAKAVEEFVLAGIDIAMNRYNKMPDAPSEAKKPDSETP